MKRDPTDDIRTQLAGVRPDVTVDPKQRCMGMLTEFARCRKVAVVDLAGEKLCRAHFRDRTVK